jgi:serine/threonine-protein kinase TNNI3K
MAPELQLPQSFGLDSFKRTFASDAYSFACVCIEVRKPHDRSILHSLSNALQQLYTGRPPFSDFPHDAAAMLTAMAGGRPQRPSDVSKRVMSDGMWELVQSCWRQNFADRPRVSEVVEIMNKMDQSFTNLVCNMLALRSDFTDKYIV